MENETQGHNSEESLVKTKEIIFPEGLTEKDIELITLQCEQQKATNPEQISGFAVAYKEAKDLAHDFEKIKSLVAEEVTDLILRFGELVESTRNKNGFRSVPANFANGNRALDPELIERAIGNFSHAYAEGLMEAAEYYKEFEEIHPFNDGNGRVGDLLWKIDVMRKTGVWPEELPPDVFSEKKEVGK